MPLTPSSLQETLLDALASQNREQLKLLVSQVQSPRTREALILLEAGQPVFDIAAVDALATQLVHTGNISQGEVFASAGLSYALQQWQLSVPDPNRDIPVYIGNLTYLRMKLLFDTGRFEQGMEDYESFANSQLPGWEEACFSGTHAQAAEHYLEAGRLDQAREIINWMENKPVAPAASILRDRLRSKLQLIMADVSSMPEDIRQAKLQQNATDTQQMMQAIEDVMAGQEHGLDADALQQLLEAAKAGKELTPAETLALTQRITASGLSFMSQLGGDASEMAVHQKRHELSLLSNIFTDESRAYDTVALKEAIPSFLALQQWFYDAGQQSVAVHVSWCLYICLNRTGEPAKAAAELKKIYDYLEIQRQGIADFHERAGVFGQYPYLFPAMAVTYFNSHQWDSLFAAIEVSKGRSLADKMLQQGIDAADPNGWQLQDRLLPLLQQYRAHYCTLFVDDDRTFSVLLTRNGKFFADDTGPGRAVLQEWLEKDWASPATWRKPKAGLFGKREDPAIPLKLGALLKPVQAAMAAGDLLPGDHLVYAADDMLHLFPLHFAWLEGHDYLIKFFSISRIQSGFQLAGLLSQPSVGAGIIQVVSCPAVQDREEKITAFREVGAWLAANGMGVNTDNNLAGVMANWQPTHQYHFATHGVFPSAALQGPSEMRHPYVNSGLLLANNGQLPSLDASFQYWQSDYLMSPRTLTEAGVNLTGAHVSMQACVSGRSAEGYGGDALGMEWALFQLGAASIMSAHWDIDVHWSNKIFIRFYEAWRRKGETKAQAYRSAVLATIEEVNEPEFGGIYYWGGLSLAGDFR